MRDKRPRRRLLHTLTGPFAHWQKPRHRRSLLRKRPRHGPDQDVLAFTRPAGPFRGFSALQTESSAGKPMMSAPSGGRRPIWLGAEQVANLLGRRLLVDALDSASREGCQA